MPLIDVNQPWVCMCPSCWTPLPPPSTSHPSGSSQCKGPEIPVSYTKLVIYFTYGNIRVSILLSQIIPPLFPQSPRVCSLSLCHFCYLRYRVINAIFLNPIYMCVSILYCWFSFQLTLLCVIGSSFIHLGRIDSNALFLIAEWYPIVYMYHSFLIHSSVDGHTGCNHVPATVNNAAFNIGVHMSLLILVSSVCMPSSGISGS